MRALYMPDQHDYRSVDLLYIVYIVTFLISDPLPAPTTYIYTC